MSDPVLKMEGVLMMPLSQLKPHPRNPNKHTPLQIERLAKIIEYQGWRYPIKVSKRSLFITSGHGRLEAAKLRGWSKVPVSYQDYDDEDQELADIVADNAISAWSDLDLAEVNAMVADLDGSFDIDHLGIDGFTVDIAERDLPEMPKESLEEMRDLKLSYNAETYDFICNRIDQLMDKHGQDSPESLIAYLLDVNI